MCSCTIKHIINEFRKRDKMRGLLDILSLFCNEFKYLTRRFVKVFPVHIKIWPFPWWLCLSTDPNNFNNLRRGSPKDHLCQSFLQ